MNSDSSRGCHTSFVTVPLNGFTVELKCYLADGADKNAVPHIFVGGWGSVAYAAYDAFAVTRSALTHSPVYVLSLPYVSPHVTLTAKVQGIPESQLWKAYVIKEVVKTFDIVHLSGYSEGALNALVAIVLLDAEGDVSKVMSYTGINPPSLTDVESIPAIVIRAIKNGISFMPHKRQYLFSEVLALESHKMSISWWVKSRGGLKEILRSMNPGRIDLKLSFLEVSKMIPVKLLAYEGDKMINWGALKSRYSALEKVDLRVHSNGHHNSIMVEPVRVAWDLEY